jgi:hypothetical protein
VLSVECLASQPGGARMKMKIEEVFWRRGQSSTLNFLLRYPVSPLWGCRTDGVNLSVRLSCHLHLSLHIGKTVLQKPLELRRDRVGY